MNKAENMSFLYFSISLTLQRYVNKEKCIKVVKKKKKLKTKRTHKIKDNQGVEHLWCKQNY